MLHFGDMAGHTRKRPGIKSRDQRHAWPLLVEGMVAFTILSALCSVPAVANEKNGTPTETKSETKPDSKLEPKSEDPKKESQTKADSDSAGPGSMTSAKIATLIAKDGDFGEGFVVNAGFEKSKKDPAKTDVIIQTWQNPKSQDLEHDSKIDSVLMSKKLMEAFPDAVASISCFKVRYFNRSDRKSYFEISVFPDVVSAFGSGQLSESSLIGTLPMTTHQAPAVEKVPVVQTAAVVPAPSGKPIDGAKVQTVLPGWNQNDRGRLLDRLKRIEKFLGQKAFECRQMVGEMETAVRDGDLVSAQKFYSALFRSVTQAEKELYASQVKPVTATATPNKDDALKTAVGGIRAQAGDFYPHNGPLYPDRVNIAQTLLNMQKSGQNVQVYRPEFLKMEALVTNNGAGIDVYVKLLNKKLKLAEMPRDADYMAHQKLSDELRKRGQD